MNRNIYLIITPTISNIGGSQIYSLNKYHFLEKKTIWSFYFTCKYWRYNLNRGDEGLEKTRC